MSINLHYILRLFNFNISLYIIPSSVRLNGYILINVPRQLTIDLLAEISAYSMNCSYAKLF